MDHKGLGIHLDFLSRSQHVILCGWQLIPNNRIPIEINSTTSTWFNLRDWIEIQGQLVQSSLLPSIPLVPKPPELPQNNRYSSHDKTHSIPNSKSPKTSHELPHNHSKIPRHAYPLPCLVPTETHATTLELFLTFLAQQKFSCQDSFHLILLIKFHFYLFTTPQNQNMTTSFSPTENQVT